MERFRFPFFKELLWTAAGLRMIIIPRPSDYSSKEPKNPFQRKYLKAMQCLPRSSMKATPAAWKPPSAEERDVAPVRGARRWTARHSRPAGTCPSTGEQER